MLYRGNRASWLRNLLTAVIVCVSIASALVSTLLAPRYMYRTLACPSCSMLLIAEVRIEKNWAGPSLATHIALTNASSGKAMSTPGTLRTDSSIVVASSSDIITHAASNPVRAMSPALFSAPPSPHRGRFWFTAVPTQFTRAHRE